jgi:hypothetical protein
MRKGHRRRAASHLSRSLHAKVDPFDSASRSACVQPDGIAARVDTALAPAAASSAVVSTGVIAGAASLLWSRVASHPLASMAAARTYALQTAPSTRPAPLAHPAAPGEGLSEADVLPSAEISTEASAEAGGCADRMDSLRVWDGSERVAMLAPAVWAGEKGFRGTLGGTQRPETWRRLKELEAGEWGEDGEDGEEVEEDEEDEDNMDEGVCWFWWKGLCPELHSFGCWLARWLAALEAALQQREVERGELEARGGLEEDEGREDDTDDDCFHDCCSWSRRLCPRLHALVWCLLAAAINRARVDPLPADQPPKQAESRATPPSPTRSGSAQDDMEIEPAEGHGQHQCAPGAYPAYGAHGLGECSTASVERSPLEIVHADRATE